LSGTQGQLFGPATPPLPEGFVYVEEFIGTQEERALLEAIGRLPLEPARYRQYTARRRIALFENGMPDFLLPLRAKVAPWLGVPAAALTHALVNEFRPGTPLGWHRDAPSYELVAGVSLGGRARMRLRPYPPAEARAKRAPALDLELAPRSAYRMQGNARWGWQHSIPATKELRYSVTFRTLRPA
jgi:alkylated DNA repair dioxygenase AlkB